MCRISFYARLEEGAPNTIWIEINKHNTFKNTLNKYTSAAFIIIIFLNDALAIAQTPKMVNPTLWQISWFD